MRYDLNDAPDLVTLLRQIIDEDRHAEVLGFLANPDDAEHGVVSWTYDRLDHEARKCGAWLQQRLAEGSRVLLLYPNGLEFVAAFIGCLYAGMIAVPAPLPGGQRHHRQRIAAIAANADVAAIMTTSAKLAETQEWATASGLERMPTVASDDPDVASPRDWTPVALNRQTTALLQYTSGSTGDPKGVVISHDNIMYNMDCHLEAVGWPERMRMVGWIPLYHDLALQALLLPALVRGAYLLLMEPMTFVRRPLLWLQLMDSLDLNITFAPNFAYALCLQKVRDEDLERLDLSRWCLAGNASEPVDAAMLAAFAERFSQAGFRAEAFAPIYGLAEATAHVSGHCGRPPRVQRVDVEKLAEGRFVEPAVHRTGRDVVSCGAPSRAFEVRIVDPVTREVLPDGWLGEIWLRGRSVASGYWGLGTAEVFGATTAEGEGGFLRTGDIGAIHDGEIYIHGRLKDTLIVHGRNIYPQDVEHELQAQHPELGRVGAVFCGLAIEEGGSDARAVVVAHEVVPNLARDRLPALAAEMRHTVGREFGVQVATVLLLRPGGVLRTTSGKVRRSAMRKMFCDGQLTALYESPSL
jgi:acyl-CoA synthetase (AMP-forming)/AMP-acid ligase II